MLVMPSLLLLLARSLRKDFWDLWPKDSRSRVWELPWELLEGPEVAKGCAAERRLEVLARVMRGVFAFGVAHREPACIDSYSPPRVALALSSHDSPQLSNNNSPQFESIEHGMSV